MISKRKFLIFIIMELIALTVGGCGQKEEFVSSKIESTSYSEKIIKVNNSLELDMVCDYANVEVYRWDNSEVKFEMKKRVRGSEEKSKLEEKLKDFNIDITQNEGKVSFTSQYKGSIKSSEDKMLDLRVYIPKRVTYVRQKIEKGYVKFIDDIKCTLRIDAKFANVEINRLEGAFDVAVGTGNIRIGSGRIKGDSSITVDTGNIFVKSLYENDIDCNYQTNCGNVELYLPSDIKLGIESYGTIEKNDFKTVKVDKGIKVSSSIGKITIKKF